MVTCVHADLAYNDEALACGKRVPNRLVHGWLCIDHYRAQQRVMPPIPKKPRFFQWDDREVIADILKTDAAAITAGNVVSVTRQGQTIKFLETAGGQA